MCMFMVYIFYGNCNYKFYIGIIAMENTIFEQQLDLKVCTWLDEVLQPVLMYKHFACLNPLQNVGFSKHSMHCPVTMYINTIAPFDFATIRFSTGQYKVLFVQEKPFKYVGYYNLSDEMLYFVHWIDEHDNHKNVVITAQMCKNYFKPYIKV